MKGAVSVFLFCVLSVAKSEITIDFPERKYVRPGDEFELRCESTTGLDVEIYTPDNDPSEEELEERNSEAIEKNSDAAFKGLTFQDASAEEHAGFYTCVAFDSTKQYVSGVCEVIVVDLCEDSGCLDEYNEVCVGDYKTGTYSCKCPDCPTQSNAFDPICTNKCNTKFHECHLNADNCKKRGNETIMFKGTCPLKKDKREPSFKGGQEQMEIPAEYGGKISLSAGVGNVGNPRGEIEWWYSSTPNGEQTLIEGANKDLYSFTLEQQNDGYYFSRVIYCGEEYEAESYHVTLDVPPTLPPTLPPDLLKQVPVCSIFPGGIVESFSGESAKYDLKCTHVLAGNVITGGDYFNPWFVYGSFDVYNGKAALSGFTFHGSATFQVLRGWIVNLDGKKVVLEEGVEINIGDSDCTAIFKNYYLSVRCDGVTLHYDGMMAGMIQIPLEEGLSFEQRLLPPEKPAGGLGLCWDNMNGGRPNWQLKSGDDTCEVDVTEEGCTEEEDGCSDHIILEDPEPYFRCSEGAANSCNELNCGNDESDEIQKCALERAALKTCEVRGLKNVGSGYDNVNCPEDPCEWKSKVVAQGCPQETPPFICV